MSGSDALAVCVQILVSQIFNGISRHRSKIKSRYGLRPI